MVGHELPEKFNDAKQRNLVVIFTPMAKIISDQQLCIWCALVFNVEKQQSGDQFSEKDE